MRWAIIFALVSVLLLLVSCGSMAQECEKPFISKDGGCCLDMDEDGGCDTEQNETKIEPEQGKEEEIVVEETEPVEIKTVEVEEETVKEEPEEVDQKITGAAVEEITEEEIEEFEKETASIDGSDLLKQLMKTYTEEVESYKYNFNSNWYYVKGDKLKIQLANSKQFSGLAVNGTHYPVFYVDTIYMGLINKTTTGYCEGTDPDLGQRRCAELDIIDVPYELSYANYYTKRPDEWLFEVYTLDPEIKTETGYYYLGPRKVRRLEYKNGIQKIIMFYDEKIGLPVKVMVYVQDQFSEMWLYDFLSINTVKDKHMCHRTADEISSKEGFYSTAN